jgi:hypothetical protein
MPEHGKRQRCPVPVRALSDRELIATPLRVLMAGRLMARHIIRFSDRWALSADNLQWVLEQYRPPKWRGVAFIASNKAVLMRVLGEKGVDITPAAKVALDHLPDTFREWKSKQDAERSEPPGRSSRGCELSGSDRLVRAGGRK